MSKTGMNISYKYNDAGIRTEKTVNGVTTNYHLVGDKVTYETNGTDSIYYTYDSSSNLVSMSLNGVEYYYIRNAQGDIIGLFDGTGTQVVSYTYDTWGKLISTTGSLASTVGVKNPYRYRGYRYDSETGLYYLQSRYYNADWGRFINADAEGGKVGTLLSHNIFAYCMNNPVNMSDPSGNWPTWVKWVVAATIVVAIVIVTVVAIASLQPELLSADAPLAAALNEVTAVVEDVAPKVQQTVQKITPRVVEKGVNFSNKAEQHMENAARHVPVQILKEAINSVKGVPDPRGSDALMHYTTMFKNGSEYNLEVLHNGVTNTIYHFEYARKAMGPLIQIFKR